ncbi:sugar phosphate isomerase/epimerase family protein [Pedosphaera parvula]|uniref:Xylose isomerase domain protein TIM barrel n=1 Tax=Pedosphaera parvula (strain Ellin514) TaxID=320771 RepID=B9XA66_PEDPL|nr:TIM barrel protein [Pedosphaera parvula]EEF63407.1 Xylose isomerase domain protein TIM barrel [Pedosphaera parvula Ellin514]
MEIRLFKTLWGHKGGLEEAIAECDSGGFDGIEGQAPAKANERRDLKARLDDAALDYIAEICTCGSYVPDRQATVEEHLKSLMEQAAAALECEPLFVTVIAGCDAWGVIKSVEFFGEAMEIGKKLGVQLSFETHRSRSLFNPWTAREILLQLPEMKLTCDFSHWCVVCERLIDTEPEIISLCAEHARHIHARVGYDQGPQVPHPTAPEYAGALTAHEKWWREIWGSQFRRGMGISTMTPEFGPDGYLHCLPFTSAPVADLRQINEWMAERQRGCFAEFSAAELKGAEAGKAGV